MMGALELCDVIVLRTDVMGVLGLCDVIVS